MKKHLVVRNDIYWVGTLDFDTRVFDIVMYTKYGTTYNSYIVKGSEKIALIEASKAQFFDEHLERLKSIVDPSEIDYLIVNHTEPDHTGSIEKLLEINPNITIVGSPFGIKFLAEIINKPFKNLIVKDGFEISLGNKTLKFLSVPLLHWPDSMYTYLVEDKTLFTCDSFGAHYCDENVFNDKIEGDFFESYKYYFDCIMGPFKQYIRKALDKISKIEVETICTGHGPVLRTDIDKYIAYYDKWSKREFKDEIIVCYVSAYGYTKILAQQIVKGIEEEGFKAKIYDLENADKKEVLDEIYTAKGLLMGTPTIADDTLPQVWEILIALNANINNGLKAGVFGSYGWNGNGIRNVESRFKCLKFVMPLDSLMIRLKPSEEQKQEAFEFGKLFTQAVKK